MKNFLWVLFGCFLGFLLASGYQPKPKIDPEIQRLQNRVSKLEKWAKEDIGLWED